MDQTYQYSMLIRCLLLVPLLIFACQSSRTQPALSANYSPPAQIMNIRHIAGQTQEDIATILGHQSQLDAESAANSGCPTCQKYAYRDGLIKIVYINDMADWITLTPAAALPARQTPALLGLPDRAPDVANQRVMKWLQYEGIKEISAFRRTDGNIIYIYVKVTTP